MIIQEDRSRGSLKEVVSCADGYAGSPLSIHHAIDNGDGSFSLMSHINCEYCNYCREANENPDLEIDIEHKSHITGPHIFQENSYGE